MKRKLVLIAVALWAAVLLAQQAIPVVSQIYTAAWTSATASGTALTAPTQGFTTAMVSFTQTSTFTAGYATFEGSDTPDRLATDNWFSVPCLAPTTNGPTYGFTANTNIAFQCNVAGFQRFRVRSSGAIGGTGTASVSMQFNSVGTPTTAVTAGTIANPVTVTPQQSTPVSATWTSATAGNTAITISTTGYTIVSVGTNISGAISLGQVTFEGSVDGGTTWSAIQGYTLGSTAASTTFTLSQANAIITFPVASTTNFRVRLSTTITNTGSQTLTVQAQAGATHVDQVQANQGTQGSQPWFGMPTLAPVTSGSTTAVVYYMPAPSFINATAINNQYNTWRTGAGNVWGYAVVNPNASTCWLQFYNGNSPTLGSAIIYAVPILGSGGIAQLLPNPINFSTAVVTATTTTASGGTTCATGMGLTLYLQ